MATTSANFFEESYEMIWQLRTESKTRLNIHLEGEFLAKHGVDVSHLELENTVDQEGLYYHPMTLKKLQVLGGHRAEAILPFWGEEDDYCDPGDSGSVVEHMFYQIRSTLGGYERENLTAWDWRSPTRSLERNLSECRIPSAPKDDPTRRHDWNMGSLMESSDRPHQICLSEHTINNVTGLVRSEMMILTSLMLAKMRRTHKDPYKTYPILMLSAIGRKARIIHAHVCPVQRRLMIRYSRFYNFTDCSQELADLFVRWLVSTPLSNELKDLKEKSDDKCSDSGDTAPQIKIAAPIPVPAPIPVRAAPISWQLRTGASALEIGQDQASRLIMPSMSFVA